MAAKARSDPEPDGDLEQVFLAHRHGLAGAVRGVLGPRADAEELLQDAYLKALRAVRRGFAPRDPVAWVFVITINLAKDRRRRAHKRGTAQSLEEDPSMELSATQPAPGARLESDEAIRAARAAIERLADPEKEVFLLRASGELSFAAAAEALGIPIGTAKTRMRTALARLRRELAAFAPGTVPSQATDSRRPTT
jgi:RNA polymerase sigma-70 factor (ECF subfamily)